MNNNFFFKLEIFAQNTITITLLYTIKKKILDSHSKMRNFANSEKAFFGRVFLRNYKQLLLYMKINVANVHFFKILPLKKIPNVEQNILRSKKILEIMWTIWSRDTFTTLKITWFFQTTKFLKKFPLIKLNYNYY